jgi:hypothetical protein
MNIRAKFSLKIWRFQVAGCRFEAPKTIDKSKIVAVLYSSTLRSFGLAVGRLNGFTGLIVLYCSVSTDTWLLSRCVAENVS